MTRFVKLAVIGATCVLGLVLALFFVIKTGVFDIVERSYHDKEAALRNGAFERGLLPSFLPESATNNSLKYNTDVGVMNGTFNFRAEDFREFVDTINSSDDGDRHHEVGVLRENQLLQEGYQCYKYSRGSTCCRFLIHPEQGHCQYAAAGPFRAKNEWANKSSLPTGKSSTVSPSTTNPNPAAGH